MRTVPRLRWTRIIPVVPSETGRSTHTGIWNTCTSVAPCSAKRRRTSLAEKEKWILLLFFFCTETKGASSVTDHWLLGLFRQLKAVILSLRNCVWETRFDVAHWTSALAGRFYCLEIVWWREERQAVNWSFVGHEGGPLEGCPIFFCLSLSIWASRRRVGVRWWIATWQKGSCKVAGGLAEGEDCSPGWPLEKVCQQACGHICDVSLWPVLTCVQVRSVTLLSRRCNPETVTATAVWGVVASNRPKSPTQKCKNMNVNDTQLIVFKNLNSHWNHLSTAESLSDLISAANCKYECETWYLYVCSAKRGFLNEVKGFNWLWYAVIDVRYSAGRWERTTICCIYTKLVFGAHTHTHTRFFLHGWPSLSVPFQSFTNRCCDNLRLRRTYFLDL